LYSYPVDGAVYAQPLYVAGVTIKGAARNVLYVATMNDKVYAFDADSSSPTPLWSTAFTNAPSVTPVPVSDIVGTNQDIVGNVGIRAAGVIARQAIYRREPRKIAACSGCPLTSAGQPRASPVVGSGPPSIRRPIQPARRHVRPQGTAAAPPWR
jgi:hypothetical protein